MQIHQVINFPAINLSQTDTAPSPATWIGVPTGWAIKYVAESSCRWCHCHPVFYLQIIRFAPLRFYWKGGLELSPKSGGEREEKEERKINEIESQPLIKLVRVNLDSTSHQRRLLPARPAFRFLISLFSSEFSCFAPFQWSC